MLKTEFSEEITVEDLVALNESCGLVLEINDGAVISAHIEEG